MKRLHLHIEQMEQPSKNGGEQTISICEIKGRCL